MPQNKLVKRLNELWPPKKKEKKKKRQIILNLNDQHHHGYLDLQAPPLLHHHCSCSNSSSAAQPSAPYLSSWLEPDQTHYAIPELTVQEDGRGGVTRSHFITSHQQYRALKPVHRVPLFSAPARRERSGGGFFRCLTKFGINAIRCFCPCFHVREVR